MALADNVGRLVFDVTDLKQGGDHQNHLQADFPESWRCQQRMCTPQTLQHDILAISRTDVPVEFSVEMNKLATAGACCFWAVITLAILSVFAAEVIRVVDVNYHTALQTSTWQE